MFEVFIWAMFVVTGIIIGGILLQNYINRVEEEANVREYIRLRRENEELLNRVLKESEVR